MNYLKSVVDKNLMNDMAVKEIALFGLKVFAISLIVSLAFFYGL